MTTKPETQRLREDICPSYCAGHQDDYQGWEGPMWDTGTLERDHAFEWPTGIDGVNVSTCRTESPVGHLGDPRVLVCVEEHVGGGDLTPAQARMFAETLTKAAALGEADR